MKTSGLSRYALFACCIAIAACSQATQLSPAQYTPNVRGVPERLGSPLAYSVVYSFNVAPDGNFPEAGLLDVSGTLYGTTIGGGEFDVGTIFTIAASGGESVLYSFSDRPDGFEPAAGLIDVSGTLYGITGEGGKYNDGAVFSITTGGSEKVLHSFGGGSADGSFPYAGLIDIKGTLYGVTTDGGSNCQPSGGCGTVFSITTRGTEKILHSFGSVSDGSAPEAALIDVSGTLYGTTALGGANGDARSSASRRAPRKSCCTALPAARMMAMIPLQA
jgi:uncharacterized repeat protein (TIGR03803 family)